MKNQLIIICLICMTSATVVNAQMSDDPRENPTLGVKAGVNVSNVWDERGEDFTADAKTGFAGGVFAAIPIGKYLGVQPEILVSQKGYQGSGRFLLTDYSYSRTTTYIDVPLQLQLKPIEYITILAGPQYSYLINEKNVYTFGSNSTTSEKDFENTNLRKNTLGAVVGLDVNISHVVLSGKMGWDLQTNNGNGSSSDPRYKNQWLQFTIGLKL